MPVKTQPLNKTTSTSSKDTIFKEIIQSNITLQEKLVDLIHSNNETAKVNQELIKAQVNTHKEIDSMVKLFREAGDHMVAETEEEKLKPLINKISELVEQNKTMMRGLILIQKYIKVSSQQEIPQRPIGPEDF